MRLGVRCTDPPELITAESANTVLEGESLDDSH